MSESETTTEKFEAQPLTAGEQKQLQTLQEIRAEKERELQAVSLGLQSFQRQILEERGLDPEGRYVVSDGQIRRVERDEEDGGGS
jgi:hypothetical protein